ncbi:hypothetical protein [Desulfosporosinus sp. Sb-LF]|uniref:hypothetical protein n=1 Tax=Desulfosporosinus sp. Sb-LF TaxID=2560027 RepID=UPI00107F7547|nr:hypothetical protein [Desulfosporosinus sp. Sb-LF]TGE30955.1 hypothetical protein E4K68_19975 [Desulfosporosinus sp. Sb-LF]
MEIKELLNINRSRMTACMTLVLSFLVLYASLAGILDKSIYEDVLSTGTITKFLLAGSVSQDIIFIPLALLLTFLSLLYLKRNGIKTFITILGLTGNFFYGYGLYSMQGQYTTIYLIYLAIFSLSIYSIIFGLLSFTPGLVVIASFPRTLRICTSIFLYCIVIMLGLVWLIRIIPDIARHIPQDTYGVYVLDLGIVFPAIAITATMLIRSKPFGNILAGVVLMKVFTVCLSWGFGEWYGRFSGIIQGSYDMLLIPTILTVISLVFLILYLAKLQITPAEFKSRVI